MSATFLRRHGATSLALGAAAFFLVGALEFPKRSSPEDLGIEVPDTLRLPAGTPSRVGVTFINRGRSPLTLLTVRGLCAAGACLNTDGIEEYVVIEAGERRTLHVTIGTMPNPGTFDLAAPVYFKGADGTLYERELRITGERVNVEADPHEDPSMDS